MQLNDSRLKLLKRDLHDDIFLGVDVASLAQQVLANHSQLGNAPFREEDRPHDLINGF